MELTILLEPEIETRLRDEAAREGLTLEQLISQRLQEAELLWRIRTVAPESETRQLHRLLRQRRAGRLTEAGQPQLQTLLDEREQNGAQRLIDLAQLAHLRSISVHQLMEHLGIRPLPTP